MQLTMQFEIMTLFNRLKFVFTKKKRDILKSSITKTSKTLRKNMQENHVV